MAVGQAVDAFRLFTGREPDAARMARTFGALIEAERAAA
jgi:shikimate dehydrogenase